MNLRRSKKRNFWQLFRTVDRAKAFIYVNGAYFEQIKGCLPHVSSIFLKKKSVLKLGPHCVMCVTLIIVVTMSAEPLIHRRT